MAARRRGIIVGLTRFLYQAHIARAALEATAYQVADLGVAMASDLGVPLPAELRVDGGMTRNELLMQIQADILGSAVVVPEITETTALGAVRRGSCRRILATSTSSGRCRLRCVAGNRRWPNVTAPLLWLVGTRAWNARSGGSEPLRTNPGEVLERATAPSTSAIRQDAGPMMADRSATPAPLA